MPRIKATIGNKMNSIAASSFENGVTAVRNFGRVLFFFDI